MREDVQVLGLEDEELARLLALTRTAMGGTFMLFPRLAGRVWTGEREHSTLGRLATRSLGARDLAIGLGTIMALEEGKPASGWLQAGVIADLSDGVGALTARGLPWFRRVLTIATAGCAVALGWRLSQSLE